MSVLWYADGERGVYRRKGDGHHSAARCSKIPDGLDRVAAVKNHQGSFPDGQKIILGKIHFQKNFIQISTSVYDSQNIDGFSFLI